MIQSIVPSRPTAPPAGVSPVFPGPTTIINHNETVSTFPPTDINPTTLAVVAPAVSPYTCRSPVSPAYQRSQPPVDTIPGVHACSVDRDCIGFVSKDSLVGTICCVHTFCTCGVMILAEDGSSTRCVGTATAPPAAAATTPGVATQSPISNGVDGGVIMPPTDPDQADVVDGRNSKQLGWQIFAVVVYFVLAFGTCSIIFLTLDKLGMLHVSAGVDLTDVDSHHHGGHAYLVRDDIAIVKKVNAMESRSKEPAEEVPQLPSSTVRDS